MQFGINFTSFIKAYDLHLDRIFFSYLFSNHLQSHYYIIKLERMVIFIEHYRYYIFISKKLFGKKLIKNYFYVCKAITFFWFNCFKKITIYYYKGIGW